MISSNELAGTKSDKGVIPPIWEIILSFLIRDDLLSISTTSHFFRTNANVALLINLITQYKLTENESSSIEKKLVSRRRGNEEKIDSNRYWLMHDGKIVKNPILIAIDALLKKDPNMAFKKTHFTDASRRSYYYSALEYAVITYNFAVIKIIRYHAKTIDSESKIDECINKFRVLDSLPIQPRFISFNSLENITDRIVIWPEKKLLPATIPKNAILMLCKGDNLFVYYMGTKTLVEDRSLLIQDALQNIPMVFHDDILKIFNEDNTLSKGYITLGDNPELFNLLRRLCQLSPLPFTLKIPSLIRHDQAGVSTILFWGKQNGKWQLHALPAEHQDKFLAIFESPNALESEAQKILKEYHTEYISLKPYLRKASLFLEKYPSSSGGYMKEFDSEIAEYIGSEQILFPAWIMQFWYTAIAFIPIPNFKELLITAHGSDRLEIQGTVDVFDPMVGVTECLLKPAEMVRLICCLRSYVSFRQVARFHAGSDFEAMSALNDLIKSEFSITLDALMQKLILFFKEYQSVEGLENIVEKALQAMREYSKKGLLEDTHSEEFKKEITFFSKPDSASLPNRYLKDSTDLIAVYRYLKENNMEVFKNCIVELPEIIQHIKEEMDAMAIDRHSEHQKDYQAVKEFVCKLDNLVSADILELETSKILIRKN